MKKKCYIIAGPNGAGKTTFANEFLPIEAGCLNFINADLIAGGLSPFQPEKVAIEAGRIMLRQMDEFVSNNESFAFETTFSGKGYAQKIKDWRSKGYAIIIYYLKLPSVNMAIERVRLRVSQGGHNVPKDVIRRRYDRSWENFQQTYRQLADSWTVFDTSGKIPVIIEESEDKS
ncbi:MAG: zeta toxin family protein [Thermodesulfobacteriota bacterium]|nr:zeta toxin family protein [Thermodesulfobacteriota bacterium]